MKKWLAMLLVAALTLGNMALALGEALEMSDDPVIIEEIEIDPEVLDAGAQDIGLLLEADVLTDEGLGLPENLNLSDEALVSGDEAADAAMSGTNEAQSSVQSWNDHKYQLFDLDDITTWDAAKAYCESLGGYLATITSAEEDTFIYNNVVLAAGYDSAYFGLTDAREEGLWEWVTGEKLDYINWAEGEPNNEFGNENYGLYYFKFSDGKWNDGNGDCGETAFICEWDESAAPQPSDPLTLNKQGVISMLPKKTLQLKATSVPAGVTAPLKWKSTAPNVAKVNAKGKVTALKKGKAIITATAEDGQSAAVEIWVSQVPAMTAPTIKRKSNTAVTVSWTPLNGVNGYEIAVGKNKNATNAVNVSGAGKKSATVYVTPGQKLYYRVRGYMNNGTKKIYGEWSKAKTFTLKRKAETYQEIGGKTFTGSNSVGNVKYTVALLDWKHEGKTTTIKTKVTFEWQKKPNSYGLDVLAMGVSGDFTNDSVQGTLEYVPWNQSGAAAKKSGGFLTVKPKVERSGKGDGVYFKITPSKVYDTYYETTTVRGAKKKVKKYRYTYATTGSIIATWSVDSAEPVTNFSIVASYADNQQKVKVDPSVNFSNGSVKFSVTAKLESKFMEGPLAYAKVKIKAQ